MSPVGAIFVPFPPKRGQICYTSPPPPIVERLILAEGGPIQCSPKAGEILVTLDLPFLAPFALLYHVCMYVCMYGHHI